MTLLTTYIRVMRYRSAMVLVLFLLLGALWHRPTDLPWAALVIAGMALFFSYSCATTVNDLTDQAADSVNVPGQKDRPLLMGVSRRTVMAISCTGAIISLLAGLAIGTSAFLVILAGLVINACYSLKPIQISHRPLLTPLYLPLGYVVLPYVLGVVVVGGVIGPPDIWLLPALYLLFVARISLKDFRDRTGDPQTGKPTMVLKYGTNVVIRLSVIAYLLGSLLLAVTAAQPLFAVCLLVFVAMATSIYVRLRSNIDLSAELMNIGFLARLGNGLILLFLGNLILGGQQADTTKVVFFISLTAFYIWQWYDYYYHTETYNFAGKGN